MIIRKRRARKSSRQWNAWSSIINEGKKINKEISKESELFVAKIDTLVASIVDSKAA